MQEIYKLAAGVIFLIAGFFAGSILTKKTREEIPYGQAWFKLLIIISLIGGICGLILGNDILMFSFFFIAIVTSRSLKR